MWNRKLGRKADHRKALLRNMATSLIENGQIETTEMKREQQLFKNYSMKLDQHMQIVMVDTLV